MTICPLMPYLQTVHSSLAACTSPTRQPRTLMVMLEFNGLPAALAVAANKCETSKDCSSSVMRTHLTNLYCLYVNVSRDCCCTLSVEDQCVNSPNVSVYFPAGALMAKLSKRASPPLAATIGEPAGHDTKLLKGRSSTLLVK